MQFSEQTNEIFKALSSFQKEVKQPKKDADNPFFKSKYVPLENVVEVIHETGGKHGLSEMTYPAQEDNAVGVGVIITHSSGQFIKFPPILLKPDKNTPQGIGAAITYARRYALSSAFGIASETDDDANSISGNNVQKPPAEAITPQQVGTLKVKALEFAKLRNQNEQKVYEALKIKDIESLSKRQADNAIKKLEGWLAKASEESA